MYSSSFFQILTTEDKTILTVKDAQKDDTGAYGLKLENDLGKDAASIPVNVIGKCHIEF